VNVFDAMKREMKNAAKKAKASGRATTVNVAARRNIKVAANVAKPGSVNVVAEQHAPIDQRP
jgi:regulator of RNase E activity RraA